MRPSRGAGGASGVKTGETPAAQLAGRVMPSAPVRQGDPERLERWLERAVTAASLGEVIDDPS
jgi:hypothetical protein